MKSSLKDKLGTCLGTVGFILYYVFLLMMIFVPLYFCDFPWWADLIILVLIFVFDFFGAFVNVAIWIWSFVVVVSGAIGVWEIFYFVFFAIYIVFFFIPAMMNLFRGVK